MDWILIGSRGFDLKRGKSLPPSGQLLSGRPRALAALHPQTYP